MEKKIKRIVWKCKEKCAKKCELSVRDVDAKLDNRFEMECYPSKCPNADGEITVAWTAEE